MSETLKPCPLCGGEAVIQRFNTHPNLPFRIICACGAEIRGGKGESESDVAERWNRRAERTCRVETTERRVSQTQTLVTKSCSACGHAFGSEEVRPILPGLDETMVLDPVDVPSYCPHCGARVVEEDS